MNFEVLYSTLCLAVNSLEIKIFFMFFNFNLIFNIKKNTFDKFSIKIIDDYGVEGDFVESQAFAFHASRTYLKLDISFP